MFIFFIVHQFCLAKLRKTAQKTSAKPRTKGRWPKGKANRLQRVKVLNYLKKVTIIAEFLFHKSVVGTSSCKDYFLSIHNWKNRS